MESSGMLEGRQGFAVHAILGLFAVGVAIGELCVMRFHIVTSFTVCQPGWFRWCSTYATSCLLGDDPNDFSQCSYGYAVGSVSLFFSVILCLCAHSKTLILNAIISLMALGWWIAAAIVLTKFSKDADDNNMPKEDARKAIIGLSWANVGLFGLCVVATLFFCIKGRGKNGRKDNEQPQQQQQQQQQVQMQPTYASAPLPAGAYAYGAPPPPAGAYAYGAPPAYGAPAYGAPPPAGYPPPAMYPPPAQW